MTDEKSLCNGFTSVVYQITFINFMGEEKNIPRYNLKNLDPYKICMSFIWTGIFGTLQTMYFFQGPYIFSVDKWFMFFLSCLWEHSVLFTSICLKSSTLEGLAEWRTHSKVKMGVTKLFFVVYFFKTFSLS